RARARAVRTRAAVRRRGRGRRGRVQGRRRGGEPGARGGVINVAVSGAAGRMGETVCDAVEGAEDMALVGRADPLLDTALQDVLGDADVVVDFTRPEAALYNARLCLESGVHCVMGTTGADLSDLE